MERTEAGALDDVRELVDAEAGHELVASRWCRWDVVQRGDGLVVTFATVSPVFGWYGAPVPSQLVWAGSTYAVVEEIFAPSMA